MEIKPKQSDHNQPIAQFLEKIVIDAGIGRLSNQPSFEEKALPQVIKDLSLIAGQKPQARRAKKSVAGFKIREGQIVGLRATLRGKRMVDFFERLIKIVLPRVRDFRGLDLKNIDEGGTLNIGLKEHQVFPEINPEQSSVSFSLGISIIPKTKIKNREEAIRRIKALGVPLKAASPKY